MARRVYFAGELFNTKDLVGNRLLAEAIDREGDGRYQCVLPQDIELDDVRSQQIRDADLRAVLDCDLALFHFDGTELDSGTVAEYLTAKFADRPAVLVRTDIRRAGDSDADPWNLMLGHWPRTRQVVAPALPLYARHEGDISAMLTALAREIVAALDEVAATEPVLAEQEADHLSAMLPKLMGLSASS